MEIISESKKVRVFGSETITIRVAINPLTEKQGFLVSIDPDGHFGKKCFFVEDVVIGGINFGY